MIQGLFLTTGGTTAARRTELGESELAYWAKRFNAPPVGKRSRNARRTWAAGASEGGQQAPSTEAPSRSRP